MGLLCFSTGNSSSRPDTSVHWNKRLPHNSSLLGLFSLPLLLSLLLLLALFSPCAIFSLQSTAGPPSLRPVSVLFHLACCYRGLDAGRLQLGSQSFSIYQSPPLLPQPATLTTLASINPDTSHPSVPSHLPYLFFRSAQKILLASPETKKKYCGSGSI